MFGLAVLAKVHRNVFLTFDRGIVKTDGVFSNDFSIVDNTFSLCDEAGIELGGVLSLVLPVISARHLIQSNALTVRGRGIICSNRFTQVEQNYVRCPSVALELEAGDCAARNNTLMGAASATAPPEEGLVILHRNAARAIITGNRLSDAPGHSILLRDDIFDLTIEDNQIDGARRFGIGTFSDVTALRRASISRNVVRNCRGEIPPQPDGTINQTQRPFGGVIVIGESEDVRLIDNVLTNNSPVGVQSNEALRWFVVYVEDVNRIEISGNRVADNIALQGFDRRPAL